MNDKPPSIQEWKELYDAATEFKRKECWNWMWDTYGFIRRQKIFTERRFSSNKESWKIVI